MSESGTTGNHCLLRIYKGETERSAEMKSGMSWIDD